MTMYDTLVPLDWNNTPYRQAYLVMAYITMVMAYKVMDETIRGTGRPISLSHYGLYSYDPYIYGLYSYGLDNTQYRQAYIVMTYIVMAYIVMA